MIALNDTFTSTGSKLKFHTEAMQGLRAGKPRVITTHLMPTDICQHVCSFCSVATRDGNVLPFDDMLAYLDILIPFGLVSVIISGGGNPILYKCPKSGKTINELIDAIDERKLQIGMITNGMPMKKYPNGRTSWKTVEPGALDKLTWVRISMSGLDHSENEVYIPDVDKNKTTLGLSYVFADIFDEPAEEHHRQVSTPGDLITIGNSREKLKPTRWADDRVGELTKQIGHYVREYTPQYCRLLPNCLEPTRIDERCATLQRIADAIDPTVVFVQHKPPQAPKHCWNGYVHPTLSPDGFCYSCDSVVLAAAEVGYREGKPKHKFADPWRLCHWSEIAKLFTEPIKSLVDSQTWCKGCVFWKQQAILESVVDGSADLTPPAEEPEHSAFV